jgi:hypothetical protein
MPFLIPVILLAGLTFAGSIVNIVKEPSRAAPPAASAVQAPAPAAPSTTVAPRAR